MKDLVKEFIELFKDNPKEMLKDSAAVFLIFTFSYLLLVLSSIQISKRTYERPCKHKICIYEQVNKKRINMNLNSENKQAIHEVLIVDMQKRLYEDGKGIMFTNDNEYTTILESLTEDVLHTESISDINDLLCGYEKLFPEEYLTLDGTLNYVLSLTLGYLVIN